MIARKKRDKKIDARIADVESFFDSAPTLTESIQLNQCIKIIDPQKFIRSHLGTAKAYSGGPVCLPYLKRIEELRAFIQCEQPLS